MVVAILAGHVFSVSPISRAAKHFLCALWDKSIKLGTWFSYAIKVTLKSGTTSDLTFLTSRGQ